MFEILKRPEVEGKSLLESAGFEDLRADVVEQIEIDCKYEGYIKRQQKEVEKNRSQFDQPIPEEFDFVSIPGLSSEAKQKLIQIRPKDLGQAGRIPGLTPAAISLLLVYLKKRGNLKASANS